MNLLQNTKNVIKEDCMPYTANVKWQIFPTIISERGKGICLKFLRDFYLLLTEVADLESQQRVCEDIIYNVFYIARILNQNFNMMLK